MGGPDCEGLVDTTGGHNLDGDGTCIASGGVGNLTAAADLGPLADNGGPLPTHAPDPNSPVIDAGSPEVPGSGGDACSASDARGVARPEGAGCDIGAFELATGQDCAGGASDDADGDGLCREDDNCPGGFNPEQGTVVFPHTVVATAADRFAWPDPADVSFVRGDLDQVAVLGTNDGGEFRRRRLPRRRRYSDDRIRLLLPRAPGRRVHGRQLADAPRRTGRAGSGVALDAPAV
jgi:hypothetical protein